MIQTSIKVPARDDQQSIQAHLIWEVVDGHDFARCNASVDASRVEHRDGFMAKRIRIRSILLREWQGLRLERQTMVVDVVRVRSSRCESRRISSRPSW